MFESYFEMDYGIFVGESNLPDGIGLGSRFDLYKPYNNKTGFYSDKHKK